MDRVIALLSPAKTLDLESPVPTRKRSEPRLLDRAEQLVDVMRTKTPDEVAALMSISDDLAALNVQRYQDFTTPHTRRDARPAVFTFAGDVYQGLHHGLAALDRVGERDLTEAQKTIRILSGLYGLLRPLDLIQPHRLEMGTKLATDRGETLYEWWGTTITDLLAEDLAASPGPAVVVDLASAEYAAAVDLDRLGARVVRPRFLDESAAGELKVISFAAKRARGEMAAWLVRNRVRSVRALRGFAESGYAHDPDRSTADAPTFVRHRSDRPV
jgi:uncharacterized protein